MIHNKEIKMRNIVYILALLVLLTISYFIYDAYIAKTRPCEQIFQQTSLNFKTNIKILEDNVSFDVGKSQIHTLSESSQKVAINLQACCVAANIGDVNYLQCQSSANRFEVELNDFSTIVSNKKGGNQEITLGQSNGTGLTPEKGSEDTILGGLLGGGPTTTSAQIVAPHPQATPAEPIKYSSLKEEVNALINKARVTSSELNQNMKTNNLGR